MDELEILQKRFDDYPRSFVLTEAMKLYAEAEDQEIAIKALEILERAAQQY